MASLFATAAVRLTIHCHPCDRAHASCIAAYPPSSQQIGGIAVLRKRRGKASCRHPIHEASLRHPQFTLAFSVDPLFLKCGRAAARQSDRIIAQKWVSSIGDPFPAELYRHARCPSFLLGRVAFGILRPFGLPLFDFVGLVCGGVKLDQRIKGFGNTLFGSARFRNRLLALLSSPRNLSRAAVRRRYISSGPGEPIRASAWC